MPLAAFARLLEVMSREEEDVVSPSEFKTQIALYATRFVGTRYTLQLTCAHIHPTHDLTMSVKHGHTNIHGAICMQTIDAKLFFSLPISAFLEYDLSYRASTK